MTIKTYEMGPGVLRLGSGGAALQVAPQVRSCTVEPSENVTRREPKKVLSGEELPAHETATYSYTLKAKLLQDLEADGVVDWSWTNAGEEQAFIYVPNSPLERGISGICYPVPMTIGGEVGGDDPESDITWRIKGTPVFGVYDPVEEEVTEDV